MESIKEFLRTLPLLSSLSDEEIELLARTSEERRFPAEAHILRKGEPGASAFILKEGAAETRLEKPTGAPLRLSKIEPGELFGEIALFDGQPRSASVITTQDSIVIEISRNLFLREVTEQPEISLKLLAVVAKRLRRAESIVSDFAERIYGDVLPRLEAAVSAQLDSAKIICEQSKERVASTVEKANHVLDAAEQRWTTLTRVLSIGGAVSALVVAALAFFGFERYHDFLNLISEKKAEAISVVEEVKRERRYLEILKETTLVFDKLRRDLQLEDGPDLSPPPDSSGHIARDFFVAHHQLMNGYLGKATKWESEILVEALELLTEINARDYILMDEAAWDNVIDTIEHAINNPPDHWRQRQRLSSLVEMLYEKMINGYSYGARALVERLEGLLESNSQRPDAAGQTALILARLDSKEEPVKEALKHLQEVRNPWRRSQAAVALIALGDEEGWETLRPDLAGQFMSGPPQETEQKQRDREKAAFTAALRLAEKAVNPPEKRHQARYFRVDELERQLSKERLSTYVNPWPETEPVGVELIGKTIFRRLTQSPSRWNRFFWQYSCELVCGLGCETSEAKGGGELCTQCFNTFSEKFYPLGKGPDRSAETCPDARGKAVASD